MKTNQPMPISPMPVEDFTSMMMDFAPEGSNRELVVWTGILGKAGAAAQHLFPYYADLTIKNGLGPRLTELVRIAIATTTQCEACLNWRDPRVYGKGIDENVLTLIEEFDTTPGFTARERSAIRYTLLFGTNHHQIGDSIWNELKANFSDQEIVQLCLYVAHYMGMGRLGHAMRMIDAHCTLPGYRLASLLDVKVAQEAVSA
jgi:alkylhydroperoxidase family enzyme